MMIARQIVVFDAADLTAESTFWAGLLGRTAGPDCWVARSTRRTIGTVSTSTANRGWAFSSRRTMFHLSGPMGRRSR